jgi:FlaA1/EpsC-like NDP-sugar epimerase
MLFDNARILITGGTGSLGSTLLRRLLLAEKGSPSRILIFSRDEAKQSALKSAYEMDPKLRDSFRERVRFQIGDVRDYSSVKTAMREIDFVFNAAALKQVPSCEFFPSEAVSTNIQGAENIVRAIEQQTTRPFPAHTVIGISTDKACKPVNVMGMTKAIQERIFLSAGERCPQTRFICVRYGNVLASRGSVIPLFKEQIKSGGPVTVTTKDMTRFLLTLNQAVDVIFSAAEHGQHGETYIPCISSARVMGVAHQLIGCRDIEIKITGVRPGEKTHEILVSEEELGRTFQRGRYLVINSLFSDAKIVPALTREFSSQNVVMDDEALTCLLWDNGFIGD